MRPAARFARAQERAAARHINWTLTLEQYEKLLAIGACTIAAALFRGQAAASIDSINTAASNSPTCFLAVAGATAGTGDRPDFLPSPR
jgi:hypothetical protein